MDVCIRAYAAVCGRPRVRSLLLLTALPRWMVGRERGQQVPCGHTREKCVGIMFQSLRLSYPMKDDYAYDVAIMRIIKETLFYLPLKAASFCQIRKTPTNYLRLECQSNSPLVTL